MSKAEKKEILTKLVQDFLTATNLETLIKIRQEIVNFFLSSNFIDHSKKDIADTALLLVGNEMSKYIIEASNKNISKETKLEINNSCVLLLTIFDLTTI